MPNEEPYNPTPREISERYQLSYPSRHLAPPPLTYTTETASAFLTVGDAYLRAMEDPENYVKRMLLRHLHLDGYPMSEFPPVPIRQWRDEMRLQTVFEVEVTYYRFGPNPEHVRLYDGRRNMASNQISGQRLHAMWVDEINDFSPPERRQIPSDADILARIDSALAAEDDREPPENITSMGDAMSVTFTDDDGEEPLVW